VNLQTVKVKFKMNIKDVIYINAIIDSYEGVAIIRTIDPKKGLVVAYTNDFMKKYFYEILNDLKNEGVEIFDIQEEVSESVDVW